MNRRANLINVYIWCTKCRLCWRTTVDQPVGLARTLFTPLTAVYLHLVSKRPTVVHAKTLPAKNNPPKTIIAQSKNILVIINIHVGVALLVCTLHYHDINVRHARVLPLSCHSYKDSWVVFCCNPTQCLTDA